MQESIFQDFVTKYVIVRAPAGIFSGILGGYGGVHGHDVKLLNARRLRYWDGAATLSELSQKGLSRPAKCQFPAEIPVELITNVIEIIPCSEKAEKSIKDIPVWTEHFEKNE